MDLATVGICRVTRASSRLSGSGFEEIGVAQTLVLGHLMAKADAHRLAAQPFLEGGADLRLSAEELSNLREVFRGRAGGMRRAGSSLRSPPYCLGP